MKLKSGIYKITCLATSRFYIGSAMSLMNRKASHFHLLRWQKHENPKLQRAWNKYGQQSFKFEVVERCDTDQLIIREQHYIDTLDPWFNIKRCASSNRGCQFIKQRKRVYQIDFKGVVIEIFDSITLAAERLGKSFAAVSLACKNKSIVRVGYLLLFETDYCVELVKILLLQKENYVVGTSRSILQVNDRGELVKEYISVSQASRETGVSTEGIVQTCQGKLKQIKGTHWKYKEEVLQ